MRISEVHKQMVEEGTLPQEKYGTNKAAGISGSNKGVKRLWRNLKHGDAYNRQNRVASKFLAEVFENKAITDAKAGRGLRGERGPNRRADRNRDGASVQT